MQWRIVAVSINKTKNNFIFFVKIFDLNETKMAHAWSPTIIYQVTRLKCKINLLLSSGHFGEIAFSSHMSKKIELKRRCRRTNPFVHRCQLRKSKNVERHLLSNISFETKAFFNFISSYNQNRSNELKTSFFIPL